MNVRYAQDVEAGVNHITDQTTLCKLGEILDIPLWKFGLSEYDPFNPTSHIPASSRETLRAACRQRRVRLAKRSRKVAFKRSMKAVFNWVPPLEAQSPGNGSTRLALGQPSDDLDHPLLPDVFDNCPNQDLGPGL